MYFCSIVCNRQNYTQLKCPFVEACLNKLICSVEYSGATEKNEIGLCEVER